MDEEVAKTCIQDRLRAIANDWLFIVLLPPFILLLFLFVTVTTSGNWIFIPSKGFFVNLIHLSSALIAFSGTISFFIFRLIEKLIDELRNAIDKLDQSASKLKGSIKGQFDSGFSLKRQYSESIGKWGQRSRKIFHYLVLAIFSFTIPIIISLGCIAADLSEALILSVALWAWGSLLFIGIGIDFLIYMTMLIEPIDPHAR